MKQPTNGMAISSLVLGILAILTSIFPFLNFFAFLIGALGIGLAAIGLRQIKRQDMVMKGKGLAISGLVTSVIGVVVTIVVLCVVFNAVQPS